MSNTEAHPFASNYENSKRGLAKHLGIDIEALGQGHSRLSMKVTENHMATNGYLHAGSVVTLADTSCGFGCMASLPEGAQSFTTIELKSNFTGTCREGTVVAEANLVHGGGRTQVWDSVVKDAASGKPIAHFRCTQMILYPKPK